MKPIKLFCLFLAFMLIAVGCKKKPSTTPLHRAVEEGNIDQIQSLIAKGADINAKTSSGRTPLHDAVLSWKTLAREYVAGLLIDKGADVNAKTASRWTPLHYTAEDGDIYVAKLLVASGADVNAKDNDGKTPLASAKDEGHEKMVELLLKYEAKE